MSRTFTLQDKAGSYDWITENCDPTDYKNMTDDEITAWVNSLIDAQRDIYLSDLSKAVETMTFPCFGYTTAVTFENADEYLTYKHNELALDIEDQRETVTEYLQDWITNPS